MVTYSWHALFSGDYNSSHNNNKALDNNNHTTADDNYNQIHYNFNYIVD